MLVLLSAGIAPGLALLSYFYLRDQYEQEPVITVFKVFLFGAILTFPIDVYSIYFICRRHAAE